MNIKLMRLQEEIQKQIQRIQNGENKEYVERVKVFF